MHGSNDVYKIVIEKQLNMKQEEIEKSITNTQKILSDKKNLQSIQKKVMKLSGLAQDITDKYPTDKSLLAVASAVSEWCDDKGSDASMDQVDKRTKDLADAFKKSTGKELIPPQSSTDDLDDLLE